MAQLTPREILRIAEPLEEIYDRMVDDLLINIARHFTISGWERTRFWEIKKLGELGALTEESARIIARYAGELPEEIREAFLEVAEVACRDIDPQLRKAADAGTLIDPHTTPRTSPAIQRALAGYVSQATDKLNLTNTTILESTRQQYLKCVQEVQRAASLAQAKQTIEVQTAEALTGQRTRVGAMRAAAEELAQAGFTGIRDTIANLNKEGLTGFYDRAGRQWSPEAYSALVIRTSSHNAAIEVIRARQAEFGGGDVFQVSSHPGARPLCYPYQGKLYSWGQDGGTILDGDGNPHEYEPISATSYGNPAGLFGCNCGHSPIPIIPGMSYLQHDDIPPKEENDIEYAESQEQRAIERRIRQEKRGVIMAEQTGDEAAVKLAQARVKQTQATMREFISRTGRPRRYDRERVVERR